MAIPWSRWATALAVVLVVGDAGSTRAQQVAARPRNPDRAAAEVLRAEHERANAALRGDTAVLKRLLADEFVAITVSGDVRRKADDLAVYAAGQIRTQALELDSLSVRVYGDVAIVTGRATRRDTLRGQSRDFQYRYTRVWVWRAGRWQVVSMQATRIPAPAPAPAPAP